MARICFPKCPLSSVIFFIYVLSAVIICVEGKSETFGTILDPAKMGLRKEKLSHFILYWHDIISARNPSAIEVAKAPSTDNSTTAFGAVFVIDDPLTLGPKLSSKLVGRAQGMYTFSAQNETGLMMTMNFAFTVGKYNGSTITIMGRNTILSKVREMPIVGGSGVFRYARGYVQAKTYWADDSNIQFGDAIVEYNIYVFHY